MIFDAKTIPFILAGKTTTTTIPVDPGGKPCRYRKGHTYTVNPRTARIEDDDGRTIEPAAIKPAIAKIMVVDIKRVDQMWHITFHLDRSENHRYLHKRSEKGYTSQHRDALPGELEAVDKDTLKQYAKQNWERYRAHQAQLNASALTLTERLESLLAQQARGVNVTRELARVQRAIEAGERRLRLDAA